MKSAIVNKIIPFSSVDGKGNRTAIFLQGCNFNCAYCHNPETINVCSNCGVCIEHCSTGAIKMIDNDIVYDKSKCCECDECIKHCPRNSSPKVTIMTVDDVIREVKKYSPFIEGITVSGGECTLNHEFITDLFIEAKKMGLTCFIDSNGSNLFSEMDNLMSVTDYVMLDVKSYDSNVHKNVIGAENDNVIKNLNYLLENKKLYEVRTVIVPSLIDNENTVNKVSSIIGSIDPDVRYKIIKYRPFGVRQIMDGYSSPDDDFMIFLRKIINENGCHNIITV